MVTIIRLKCIGTVMAAQNFIEVTPFLIFSRQPTKLQFWRVERKHRKAEFRFAPQLPNGASINQLSLTGFQLQNSSFACANDGAYQEYVSFTVRRPPRWELYLQAVLLPGETITFPSARGLRSAWICCFFNFSNSFVGKTSDWRDGHILRTFNHVNFQKLSPPTGLLGPRIPLVFMTNRMFFRSSEMSSGIFSLLFPLNFTFMHLSVRLNTPNHSLQKDIDRERWCKDCKKTLNMSFSAKTIAPSVFL